MKDREGTRERRLGLGDGGKGTGGRKRGDGKEGTQERRGERGRRECLAAGLDASRHESTWMHPIG